MKTTMGGAVMLVMMLAVPAADLAAQQSRAPGPRARADRMDRQAGRAGATGVEAVLRMRDRLELTGDQVARLDALRSERVERRAQEAAEVSELRSRLLAGTIDRSEATERMTALREARAGCAGQDRQALESLLDESQRATLDQLRAERRAFEAGRRIGMREQARGARAQGGTWRNAPRRGPL